MHRKGPGEFSVPAPKVAIACQGGGSHAAFVAGILCGLLAPETRDSFQLVGLSGTSGGAVCAALAWSGLIGGGPAEAIHRLLGFWRDLETQDWMDVAFNLWGQWLARMPVSAEVSPYLYEPMAEGRLRQLLRRHVKFEALPRSMSVRSAPKLLVGATEIRTGQRVIFEGETLTEDDLIASAAIPPLFRAVSAGDHLYWDGLFSTNPPVREFTDLHPDEIWVVQINPQKRAQEPVAMSDIVDRRNELAGNLSLAQELYFVDKINQLLKDHPSLTDRYAPITVRVVELDFVDLDYPSKLDRSTAFIQSLILDGRSKAGRFFEPGSIWSGRDNPPSRPIFPKRA